MAICEICNNKFIPRDEKRSPRTCSKICKNNLARLNTIKQFEDPAAREIQRQKSINQKKDPAYQEKYKSAIAARTLRWSQQGHPRIGLTQSNETKEKIGKSNKGRFKGKTWEEIFGKETAVRRKIENSLLMSKSNEILLKEKRSKLEDKILPYLPNYENNIQISYYNVDFLNKETKHIIEIHGDFWHCNPTIYNEDFMHPYFKITAKEKRKLDEERRQNLESLGYTVTVIWESDLNNFIESLKNANTN
jgi:very-short-patch-repair endonuclease